MSKVLNLENLKGSSTKIFFDNYSGFQRIDRPTYPRAVKLEENMRNAFWNPNEIKMTDDSVKFFTMPKNVQDMMCAIWFYQTLMDSTQNRGLEETLSNFITNPEWEMLVKTWAYFEQIHSISYSHIIRALFTATGSDVFERNMENSHIKDRVKREVETYNYLSEFEPQENEEGIKQILELILRVYALEGIKFYASFALTYCVNDYYDSIPGATRIIKLINYDEDTHTQASVILLDTLREDPNFAKVIESKWFKEKAIEVFKQTFEDEFHFASYLVDEFNVDDIIEIEDIENFLKYYVDERLQALNVEGIFNVEETPFVKWFKEQKDLNKLNAALQESDIAVYNKGILTMDL